MCLVCVDYIKGSLTFDEAWRNLLEISSTLTEEHFVEVINVLGEVEDEKFVKSNN